MTQIKQRRLSKSPLNTDENIRLLNSMGLSTTFIGKLLGLHQTSVSYRLKQLGVSSFNNKKTHTPIMEHIVANLSYEEFVWFKNQVQSIGSARDVFLDLLHKEYQREKQSAINEQFNE